MPLLLLGGAGVIAALGWAIGAQGQGNQGTVTNNYGLFGGQLDGGALVIVLAVIILALWLYVGPGKKWLK